MDVLRHRNPLRGGALASIHDPRLRREGERFRLTGTLADRGVGLRSSTGMLSRRSEGLIPDRGSPGSRAGCRDRFGAPRIQRWRGRFRLAFNGNTEAPGVLHPCGLAAASALRGPNVLASRDRPPVERGDDPTLFADVDDRSYAFWNTGSAICGWHLGLATGGIAGRIFERIGSSHRFRDGIGIGGSFVLRRGERCFLFLTSWIRGYETGYAEARDPAGLWEEAAGDLVFGAMDEDVCCRRGIPFDQDAGSPSVAIGHTTNITGGSGRDRPVARCRRRGEPRSPVCKQLRLADDTVRIDPPTDGERVVPRRYPAGGDHERP